MSDAAPLAEVFVSFQGEGPLVGVRQAFVRVRGCDIHCSWCDTPQARATDGDCSLTLNASAEPVRLPNPFSPAAALEAVLRAMEHTPAGAAIHSVAVTGGEPLLYPEFVAEFARLSAAAGLPLYLETGGHRPEDLAKVIHAVEYVSSDYKLPGTVREAIRCARFVETYRIAGDRCVAVKIVVCADTPPADISNACRALAAVSNAGPVVLQPVTALGGARPPDAAQLEALFLAAGEHIRDVRVIPQCHRILGVV